jgi:hypothetical protein
MERIVSIIPGPISVVRGPISEREIDAYREVAVAGVPVVIRGVPVIAVRAVVGRPRGVSVEARRHIGIASAPVDASEFKGTVVPVEIVVGVVPAGIVVVEIVPRIHRRIGRSDSETNTSEAERNGELAPGILSGRGVRAPGDRESDQESRPHQFGHDVPPWEILSPSLCIGRANRRLRPKAHISCGKTPPLPVWTERVCPHKRTDLDR